ncbi:MULTISPECIES: helix-turn-helix domain-containing protein [unclassified Acinetobacter]|uniref:helix-turn-helix domain-containing protein n=1 Tax=unclassified Acinetobacter TaxID=196816 RepID=UPI0015D3F5F9|nr:MULTISPECIES: helix-turn-helix domain-containing protein [unclassified Acinetobacter]
MALNQHGNKKMSFKHKHKPITDDWLLLTTRETARLLGYAEQTLRKWALYENGPINPIRHGRTFRWGKAKVYKFACLKED